MSLLPISHRTQRRQADCLAACAAMVLDYLGLTVAYERLTNLLRIGPGGAPFRNLRFLAQLGVEITIRQGTVDSLTASIRSGQPPLVFVDTSELPYWTKRTNHALVVAGIEPTTLYVHDPAFTDAPLPMPVGEFELAWLALDEWYATIA